METPVQMCVDSSTGHDTQEPTLIVKSADLPRNQEPEHSHAGHRRKDSLKKDWHIIVMGQ